MHRSFEGHYCLMGCSYLIFTVGIHNPAECSMQADSLSSHLQTYSTMLIFE